MSKADEWAKRRSETEGNRPVFRGEAYGSEPGKTNREEIARVDNDGNLPIGKSIRVRDLPPKTALAFADWIKDTFE